MANENGSPRAISAGVYIPIGPPSASPPKYWRNSPIPPRKSGGNPPIRQFGWRVLSPTSEWRISPI